MAQEEAPVPVQLSAVQTTNIERWAEIYKIPKAEALEQYRILVGNDFPREVKAIVFFEKRNAFEIAAAALLEARDDNISGRMVDILENKKEFSRTCYEVAIRKLETLNNIPEELEEQSSGEHVAGIEMVKSRLATLISKWVGIPDPDIIARVADTKPGYRKFIAQAKLKAAGMTGDSPF
jgi:hypothetical protein